MIHYLVTAGVSFCGSTVLDMLTHHAIEEVTAVGEIHWVMDRKPPYDNFVIEAFRRAKSRSKSEIDLYPEIRRELGAEVLHTSDKAPHNLVRFAMPLDNIGFVLLFKTPLGWVQSRRKHHAAILRNQGLPFEPLDIVNAVDVWQWFYQHLSTMTRGKPRAYLSYETLCHCPNAVLKSLARHFGLTYLPDWRKRWDAESVIRLGGNTAAVQSLKEAPSIRYDESFKQLPADVVEQAKSVTTAWDLYSQMKQKEHQWLR